MNFRSRLFMLACVVIWLAGAAGRVARVTAEGKAAVWSEDADGVVAATLERGRTYEVAFR